MHPTVPYRMVRSSGGIGFSPWTGLAMGVKRWILVFNVLI